MIFTDILSLSLSARVECTVHFVSNSANNVDKASNTTTIPEKSSGCSCTGRTHRSIRHKLVSRDGLLDFPNVRDVSQETFGSISTSQFPASAELLPPESRPVPRAADSKVFGRSTRTGIDFLSRDFDELGSRTSETARSSAVAGDRTRHERELRLD